MWNGTKSIIGGFLELVAPEHCPGCDAILGWRERGFCEVCEPLLEPLAEGPAAYEFGGPMADAIRRLKYDRRVDHAAVLGELLARRAVPLRGRVHEVVPLPLHQRRRHERGFDQARMLAEPVARALGVPLVDRLTRVRETSAQAALDAWRRSTNVQGAFVAKPFETKLRVLLIDDVYTTGSTMRAAGGALYKAGAGDVRPLALARAE